MEPASSEANGIRPPSWRGVVFALLGLSLFGVCVDLLLHAVEAGQNERVLLYAVATSVLVVGTVYGGMK